MLGEKKIKSDNKKKKKICYSRGSDSTTQTTSVCGLSQFRKNKQNKKTKHTKTTRLAVQTVKIQSKAKKNTDLEWQCEQGLTLLSFKN